MKKPLLLALLFSLLAACATTAEAPTTYSKEQQAVVLLKGPYWQGSGVVIEMTAAGEQQCKVSVVTARHVITTKAEGKLVPAEVTLDGTAPTSTTYHASTDIGFLVYRLPKPCANLAYQPTTMRADPLTPLDRLLHVGYPREEFMVGWGTYVGQVEYKGEVYSAMTSVAGPGSSGGAIFHKGELVGILVAGEMAPPFRNYFTPIARLYEILPVPVLSASARAP